MGRGEKASLSSFRSQDSSLELLACVACSGVPHSSICLGTEPVYKAVLVIETYSWVRRLTPSRKTTMTDLFHLHHCLFDPGLTLLYSYRPCHLHHHYPYHGRCHSCHPVHRHLYRTTNKITKMKKYSVKIRLSP